MLSTISQVGVGDLLGGIPHDIEAIVVYLVLLGFAGFVLLGARKKKE